MASPTVSIVVCTYNGAKFLREQLDSLIHQTYKELEILIADDRSADDTVVVAREFAAKDHRIRVHVNEQNLGYNKNFEQAFHLASGELIAVCDQDDIWKLDKVEQMLPLFKDDQTLLAHSQSVRFKDQPPDVQQYTIRRYFEGNDVRKVIYYNTIAGHNIMFRKELLRYAGNFPADVFYDWWLVILAAVYGKVNGTDKVLSFHRWHTENLTLRKKDERTHTKRSVAERIRTLEAVLRIPALTGRDRLFAEELLKAHRTLDGKSFSFPLFIFLVNHGNKVLFFKRKIWSRVKMGFRLSFCKG